jgi:hypothetical protein
MIFHYYGNHTHKLYPNGALFYLGKIYLSLPEVSPIILQLRLQTLKCDIEAPHTSINCYVRHFFIFLPMIPFKILIIKIKKILEEPFEKINKLKGLI